MLMGNQWTRSINDLKAETRRFNVEMFNVEMLNVESGRLIILIPCSCRLFHPLLASKWMLCCVCAAHNKYGFHSAFSSLSSVSLFDSSSPSHKHHHQSLMRSSSMITLKLYGSGFMFLSIKWKPSNVVFCFSLISDINQQCFQDFFETLWI